MIPILYENVTEGTVPQSHGKGNLTDCLSCKVTEERNGSYELVMEYAASGIHADEILCDRFIKAKPNFTDSPQLFRIYQVTKVLNGKFTVKAQHISYDLSGKLIQSGTAASCAAACTLLQASAGNYTINTDKTTSATFKVSVPGSVRSWFGGRSGSMLDVFGGEWYYDNYTASLKNARGSNRGVIIRYGKNLTELSQEMNIANLCTGVLPYYVAQDGTVTVGPESSTGLHHDVPKGIAIDFSNDVNPDSATPISTQLTQLAHKYIANNILTSAITSVTLDFVQLQGLEERVDLCDTVTIYFEALGINMSAKCVKTEWDVLLERYSKTTFGTLRTNIADAFHSVQREVEETPTRSSMSESIGHATALITGNLGGYVILHDSNNDGQPDEILIMDTADITTATKVWRWNKNGLGYSSTGYTGAYGTAITADGKIVADYIKTGTLNADLIKAGTIEDVAHNSQIDMTSGVATLKDLKAKASLTLIDTNGDSRAYITYSSNDGATIRALDGSGHTLASLDGLPTGYGMITVLDSSGNQSATLFADASGAKLALVDTSGHYGSSIDLVNEDGNFVGSFYTNSAKSATFAMYDQHNTANIVESGDTGNITCVSLTQTSSKKVKKNIKPIEDANKILELQAVSFDYKNEAQGKNKRGFIAEDVAEVLPDLVAPETEKTPATLDYIQMIPYLQAVIKEQNERIRVLEEKNK